MKTIAPLLCAIAVLATASHVIAEDGEGEKKGKRLPKNAAGAVAQVSDTALVVKNARTGERSFELLSSTQILKADGSAGTLEDLRSAKRVRVTADATGGIAEKVIIAGGGKAGGKTGGSESSE